MAKNFEDSNDNEKAISFYKKGKHYLHAIRIAKLGGDDDEVYSSAILAPPHVQIKTAPYFEKKGFVEKAVILHMKGKNLKKALNLAMKNNLSEYIQQITVLMGDSKADASEMKDLGDMFVDKGNAERAFGMYVASGQNDKAIELLEQNNIVLNAETVR
jgi:hypothetical protein